MTTRNGRSVWQVWSVLGLWCLCVLAAPVAARGDGSTSFNGGSTGTSKLQNENGNVLNGGNNMTICAWVYPAGQGEGGAGMLLGLDKAGNGIRIHRDASSTLAFIAKWNLGDGKWTIPVSSNVWSAVAFTYINTDDYNDPSARVNFSSATVTQVGSNPSGSAIAATSGYCVGNLSGNANTWDGRISHVQVFNRILSAAEMDAALLTPGSVRNGLRLWLPMVNAGDIYDRSGNGFDGAATDLTTGAGGPAITRELTLPPGVNVVPAGTTTIPQLVIARYANGTTHPAGQLRGSGPASVIRANSSTGSLPMAKRAAVMTEDYDYPNGIDYWQSGAFASFGGDVSTASASNSPITITTALNHGRTTGETVTISGNSYSAANGTRTIAVTGLMTFTLDGTSGSSGSGNNGTWAFYGLPLTGSISSVSSGGSPVTVTTNAPHGFMDVVHDGHFITISGVTGAGTAINATHAIDVTGTTTFTVPVSTSGAGSGGKWTYDQRRAVMRPVLRDLTIAGYADTSGTPPYNDPAGDNYTGLGIINSEPGIWHKVAGRVAAISGTGTVTVTSPTHSLVTGKTVTITGLQGYTLSSYTATVTAPNADTFTLNSVTGSGTHTPNTGIWTSTNSWPDREHGALVRGTGAQVENVNFFYIPGTCLSLAAGYAPTNRKARVLPFDSEKARVWNCQFSRAYRGVDIAIVDAIVGRLNGFDLRDYGVKFVSGSTQIDGALHFYGVGTGGTDEPAVWFPSKAGPCWGGPIYAESSPVGIRIDNSGNKLTGVYSHSCFLRNLWITGERNSIENFEIDVYNGITETNGGEAVLIANQSNSLLNGTIGANAPVPAGEIAVRITNGTRQVIRDVAFVGTDGSSAPVVSVQGTLTGSRLDIIGWCEANANTQETFVDLYGGSVDRLGTGNVIFISAENYATPVKLSPSGWDKETNLIVANGVRVLGSITGATNASSPNPIVITSAGHELREGEKVTIAAVQGNTNANGSYYVDVLSADTFALYTNETLTTARSGNGAYTTSTGYWGKRFNSVDVAGN